MTAAIQFTAIDFARTGKLMSSLVALAASFREYSWIEPGNDGGGTYALDYEQAAIAACKHFDPSYAGTEGQHGHIHIYVEKLLRSSWNETLDNANVILSPQEVLAINAIELPAKKVKKSKAKQIDGLQVLG